MKRHNVLKEIQRKIKVGQGFRTRGDLDATRHLVLHRISVRRKVHQQQDISTTVCVIKEYDERS